MTDRPHRLVPALALASLLASTTGCLSAPDEVKFVRFFRPEMIAPAESVATVDRAPLLVRRVSAASHLREPIAWEKDGIEIGQYEDRRWSEPPQQFVARALDDELFARRRIVEASGGDSVEVDVDAFEQVLGEPSHAKVAIRVVLSGARGTLRREFTSEVPIGDDSPEALARAMGRALSSTIVEVADWLATTSLSGAPTATG